MLEGQGEATVEEESVLQEHIVASPEAEDIRSVSPSDFHSFSPSSDLDVIRNNNTKCILYEKQLDIEFELEEDGFVLTLTSSEHDLPSSFQEFHSDIPRDKHPNIDDPHQRHV